jgi:hypothetical protein
MRHAGWSLMLRPTETVHKIPKFHSSSDLDRLHPMISAAISSLLSASPPPGTCSSQIWFAARFVRIHDVHDYSDSCRRSRQFAGFGCDAFGPSQPAIARLYQAVFWTHAPQTRTWSSLRWVQSRPSDVFNRQADFLLACSFLVAFLVTFSLLVHRDIARCRR